MNQLSSTVPTFGPELPDSIFVWQFLVGNGHRWGGWLVADSDLFAPGDTLAGVAGSYTILSEEQRGVDLSAANLDDGQVFVDWYWAGSVAGFRPVRGGAGQPAGTAGLGSELDAAWTGSAWIPFGLGGQLRLEGQPFLADVRLSWTFEASSGDRWSGVLFERAGALRPGDSVVTASGVYRITAEAAVEMDAAPMGTVRLSGRYFDAGSGLLMHIAGTDDSRDHGTGGLGSENGQAWTGTTFASFGAGGAQQVDAAPGSFGFERHILTLTQFGTNISAGGWANNTIFPRLLGDVNGDGRADIVGFGMGGVFTALANTTSGFQSQQLMLTQFGTNIPAGGWANTETFPRLLGDVNGDGRADIVGFGMGGVFTALANGSGGFQPHQLVLNQFGTNISAGGWASNSIFPRLLGDVNGDGRADIVGFGMGGVFVALANGSGGFQSQQLVLTQFGTNISAGGWASNTIFPRLLGDVNGDGRADIAGFGMGGVFVALANGSGGFQPHQLVLNQFGTNISAGGWANTETFPRLLDDVNGDDRADIVGFGMAGAFVSLSGVLDPF